MTMPLRQSMRIGAYLMRQKLARKDKFPLLVELEPLFACNLKCAGCGKIQQPHTLLKQRMPVAQAIGAIEESGAPARSAVSTSRIELEELADPATSTRSESAATARMARCRLVVA